MIKFIEELSFNAWPSIETLVYDGWILRFANGYTKRSNSVNPLYPSKEDPVKKIETCEELFHFRKLPVVFKLTSDPSAKKLDELLGQKGYITIDHTSVRVADISEVPSIIMKNIVIYTSLEEKWLQDYCRLNEIRYEHMDILKLLLNSIAPEKYFISLVKDGEAIACGLGVVENGYIGLFDIVVDKSHRGKGYGQQLILDLLELGRKRGARFSYLQVVARNIPAVHLYSKLGYKEKYRYWYRVKL
ncbi:MAG: GNAT family N-acetyltransferase [Bacillota bacterium]|nr:GNAT family N-acetyltransferase [Bacillota bacterium]